MAMPCKFFFVFDCLHLTLVLRVFRCIALHSPLVRLLLHDFYIRLHNLRFEKGGNAFYTNQYVPSIRHQIEEDLGEDLFHGLGEYKGFIGLAKLSVTEPLIKPFFEGRDDDDDEHDLISSPPNTACLMYRNKFYCLNEANIPLECRILPDGRLEKVGYESFGGVLDYPVSAHPRIDENGGRVSIFLFCLSFLYFVSFVNK